MTTQPHLMKVAAPLNPFSGVQQLSSAPHSIAACTKVNEGPPQTIDLTDPLGKEFLSEDQPSWECGINNVIGVSNGAESGIEQVRRIASGNQMVLIRGEIGTEKEAIARLVHRLSPRNRDAFISVHCAGQTSNILAGQLFGNERESFSQWRTGRVELANLGTLFLEEIADLPKELQSRLLLMLKGRRVHSREALAGGPLNIRLLASTSRDLSALTTAGRFNKELYELLMASLIQVLPLRKRAADIPWLVHHFVSKFAGQMNKTINCIPQETMSALCAGEWPGNLRELKHYIERAVLLTPGSTLHAPMVELEVLHDGSLRSAERHHILRILKMTGGAIGGPGGAASKLGLKRTTLNSKLKKLGIQREDYR
jgi:formate hydrogenlyase transcriptional activator